MSRLQDIAALPAVLGMLRDAALAGLVAPTNTMIARQVGLGADHRVTALLAAAKRDGRITAEYRGRRSRVIAAADGSWRTARPDGWDDRPARVTAAQPQRQKVGVGITNPDAALAAAKVWRMWEDCVLPVDSRGGGRAGTAARRRYWRFLPQLGRSRAAAAGRFFGGCAVTAPPVCFRGVDYSPPQAKRRAAVAQGVATGLCGCGLDGPDRMLVLVGTLAAEVLQTARGDETAAVDYLTALFARLVGESVGEAAGLAALTPRGRA